MATYIHRSSMHNNQYRRLLCPQKVCSNWHKLESSNLTQFSYCLPGHNIGSYRSRAWSLSLSPLQISITSSRYFTCAAEWLTITRVSRTFCSGSVNLFGQLTELREIPGDFTGISQICRWRSHRAICVGRGLSRTTAQEPSQVLPVQNLLKLATVPEWGLLKIHWWSL